jgi:dihydroorotate dehydrogenase
LEQSLLYLNLAIQNLEFLETMMKTLLLIGLGFNNKGVDYLVNNLKKRKYKGILGINIGANKNSNGADRINDYIVCLQKVSQYADYITINISSPNTPNLRDLHNSENLSFVNKCYK